MENTKTHFNDLGMKYEDAFGDDAVLRQMVQKFAGMLPPDAHVLECGSGTGKPVAEAIIQSGLHIHGIDIAHGMVALSQKQVPGGTFEVADMLQYQPSKQYHGIIASLSTFTLSRDELRKMSQKWCEWLLPGGLLLINTFRLEDCTKQVKPEAYDPDGLGAINIRWPFMNMDVYITLLTRQGWALMLQAARFTIVETHEDLFVPKAESGSDAEPRYYVIARLMNQRTIRTPVASPWGLLLHSKTKMAEAAKSDGSI